MGCGNSKQGAEEIELRPRTTENRQLRTSSQVPQSRRGETRFQQSSGATTATRTHTRRDTARSSHSRQRDLTTAQRRDHRTRSNYRVPRTIEETEDKVIHHDLGRLASNINQHSLNFYSANADLVSRIIGRSILDEVIIGRVDGTSLYAPPLLFNKTQLQVIASIVANHLLDRLAHYPSSQTEEQRNTHLAQICNEGVSIRRSIDNHPATWTFGSWDPGIRFPSVRRDGHEVSPAEI